MLRLRNLLALAFTFALLTAFWAGSAALAQLEGGGDIPESFVPVGGQLDYTRTDVLIPMRDGVRLFTVIITPKNVAGEMPVLLTRMPYDASKRVSNADSPRVAAVLPLSDEPLLRAGYIRVYQDIRGKHKSEGSYVVTLPLRGPLNPGAADHSTDAWDTIDWLVKNVPRNNGRVGITGTSYNGFTALMALVNPHPALKVAVPVNPMVDGWIGDDWFHNGAFRLVMTDFVYGQTSSKDSRFRIPRGVYDDYEFFLTGSAGDVGRRYGLDKLPFWRRLKANPAYTQYWRQQAMDRLLTSQPLTVPTMFVQGLYDQEDIYGAVAAYRAVEPKDSHNDRNYLVLGPWHHGQSNIEGTSVGAIHWGSDTSRYFREQILQPFLDRYLKDPVPSQLLSPVLAFETGRKEWRSYDAWPRSCESGCPSQGVRLYLEPGLKLGFRPPPHGGEAFDEYISDPSKPVPYRLRPIRPIQATGSTWRYWLADDQRPFSDRPDVLTFVSEELKQPIAIAGAPIAHIHASTSGSDSDWVVKLIDVYPGEVPAQPELGGYQLMVSANIFRGRYRRDLARAEALESNVALPYKIALPDAHHTFLPRHRIMVQIQSSWFPLYDRNPQRFVENIFAAKLSDYRRATQRIYHGDGKISFIQLPTYSEESDSPTRCLTTG